MLSIYYTEIDKTYHEWLMLEYLPLLPIRTQIKIRQLFKWEDAQLSLLGYLLLLYGLRQLNLPNKDCHDIVFDTYGKPFFANDSVFFNISHSGEYVICGLWDKPMIGIDIEKIRAIEYPYDFKDHFSPNEMSQIMINHTVFYNLWTQKEAVTKAIGKGLGIPFKSFSLESNMSTRVYNQQLYLLNIRLAAPYVCHLATNIKVNLSDVSISRLTISNLILNLQLT